MPFEPLSFERHGGCKMTVDALKRLRLNSAAMRELKLTAHQYVVMVIDVDLKRIGVAKQELAKAPGANAIKICLLDTSDAADD
jgi:hypothetical protein